MCTKTQEIEILQKVYVGCSYVFRSAVKKAYLYGSYARGDYHEYSDILIFADLSQQEISSLRKEVAVITS